MKSQKIWLNLIRVVLAIMLVFWMIIIFCYSAASGSESGQVSHGVTETIIDITYPNFPTLPIEKQESIFAFMHTFIRKSAHFINFFILGILSYSFILTFKLKKLLVFIISSSFCLIYAISDELHQLFVPNRGAQIKDVLIDFSGALIGILLEILIIFIYLKIKNKSQKITQ